MGGTGEHYAKGDKPGSEGQIPYDLTFNWNLVNKTSKQNITRDIEIKNNLTVTRGEVECDKWGKGKRVFRNYYKGYIDKIKGEGGGGGGRWVQLGGWRDGEKRHTTVIE